MQKKLIIIILLVLTSSCNKVQKEIDKQQQIQSKAEYHQLGYGTNTIEHDGCEYVIWNASEKGGITHKGNCKYCLERNAGIHK